jgi:hypothetical protein
VRVNLIVPVKKENGAAQNVALISPKMKQNDLVKMISVIK